MPTTPAALRDALAPLGTRLTAFTRELIHFGSKNARACLFPVFIFTMLALSRLIALPVARYDFLLLACLAMQVFMLASGLETRDELKVITLFHLLGLGLELFKVHAGSWSYPEAALIYLNFFTHHVLPDLRYVLMAVVLVVFGRTWVEFTPLHTKRRIPLVLAFLLIGVFVWFAENIATFFGAWQYPDQIDGWRVVSLSKLTSWSLLVIVSLMAVVQLKRVKGSRVGEEQVVVTYPGRR